MYFRDTSYKFFIEIGGFLLITGTYFYSVTLKKRNIISRSILQIREDQTSFTFQTSDFMLLFTFNKSGTIFEINKNDIQLKTIDYPLARSLNYKGDAFAVIYKEKEYYILSTFFTDDIIKELSSNNHRVKTH
jgi:hypothetical protein